MMAVPIIYVRHASVDRDAIKARLTSAAAELYDQSLKLHLPYINYREWCAYLATEHDAPKMLY